MVIAIFAILMLSATPIEEEESDRASGFADCFRLLGKPFIVSILFSALTHIIHKPTFAP